MEIGYQLYSSRNFGPLLATLERLKHLGIVRVEGYGALVETQVARAALAAALSDQGLTMPSCHVGLDQLQADPASLAPLKDGVGLSLVVAPFIAGDQRPVDAPGWQALGARLQGIGRELQRLGFGFAWHNHDFEFRPLPDGSLPLDHMLAAAPDLAVELDIAWVVRAEQDAAAQIRRLGPRLAAVHLKDVAAPGAAQTEDGWADLGQGGLDWTELAAALRASGVGYGILEHDNPSDEDRFMIRSARFALDRWRS